MVGACIVGLILRSPKIRRAAMLIEANETRAASMSFLTGFTVMAAYLILRPVRDSMASDWSQTEISQLWTIQFFLSLGLVVVYGARVLEDSFQVSRTGRLCVLRGDIRPVLRLAVRHRRRLLDKTFYVWVSLFSLFHLSVFWSFMADIYNSDQAKRLFPFIGAGVSTGAAAAPLVVAVLAADVGNDL